MTNIQTIDDLTRIIQNSAKYRYISDDLIRHLVAHELETGQSEKAVVKTVKTKLHQIGGAFFEGKVRYDYWLSILARASESSEPLKMREACISIMAHHASTRERIPILDEFYPTILAEIQPIQTVLDLACGLNPLSIPWMQLDKSVIYYACDIYEDLVAFLGDAMKAMGVDGRSRTCDLSADIPTDAVDLALVMKALPTLAQIDKGASVRLLSGLQARYILVSYPIRSLGGRNKQMMANYERDFYRLIEGQSWPVRRYTFSSELAFLVEKN